jgi:hypothetical protein
MESCKEKRKDVIQEIQTMCKNEPDITIKDLETILNGIKTQEVLEN